MIQFLRSVLFNILFFLTSTVLCIGLIWTLFLPRKTAMIFYTFYFRFIYWLELLILGVDYKLEGIENLPKDRNYIIAAKHQSAMETMWLPLIFKDPTIVLKKELMSIPLWGWYAKKGGMIGIDRKARDQALKKVADEAHIAFEEQRPIIIFPQGTRVSVDENAKELPYKRGVFRLYDELNCPVVPIALNTGFFWGKNKFLKRSGRATLKILPLIAPGMSSPDFMAKIREELDTHSAQLVDDARADYDTKANQRAWQDIIGFFLILFAALSFYWVWCSNKVEQALLDLRQDMQIEAPIDISYGDTSLSGFPFSIALTINDLSIKNTQFEISIPELKAHALPLPGRSVFLASNAPITIRPYSNKQRSPLTIDSLSMEVANVVPLFNFFDSPSQTQSYQLRSMTIESGALTLNAQGYVKQDFDTLAHNGELIFVLDGIEAFINQLIEQGEVKRMPTQFVLSILENQSKNWRNNKANQARYDLSRFDEKALIIPITIDNNQIFAGMVSLGSIGPVIERPINEKKTPKSFEEDVITPDSEVPYVLDDIDMPPQPIAP